MFLVLRKLITDYITSLAVFSLPLLLMLPLLHKVCCHCHQLHDRPNAGKVGLPEYPHHDQQTTQGLRIHCLHLQRQVIQATLHEDQQAKQQAGQGQLCECPVGAVVKPFQLLLELPERQTLVLFLQIQTDMQHSVTGLR